MLSTVCCGLNWICWFIQPGAKQIEELYGTLILLTRTVQSHGTECVSHISLHVRVLACPVYEEVVGGGRLGASRIELDWLKFTVE